MDSFELDVFKNIIWNLHFIQFACSQSSPISEHPNATGTFLSGARLSLSIVTLTGTHKGS